MRKLISIGCICLSSVLYGQSTLFKETFKNNGYFDGPASDYNYYDNSNSMYSSDIIRISNSSPSNYPGASGGSFLFLGPVATSVLRPLIVISGINTSAYINIKLSFGATTWWGPASDYMDISYSTNGNTWTLMDDTDLSSGSYISATWSKVTLNESLPSAENLRLKIHVTSTSQIVKFDDIELTGDILESIPPSTPSNLNYSDLTFNGLLLKWDASTDNTGIARYDIYDGSSLLTSSFSPSAKILYLNAGTQATLKVQAVDLSGNKSDFSNELIVSIPDMPADHIFSWERDQAKVLETGDLEWQPEDFEFITGSSVRYIDYESGNDSNDGISKSTPWQHHPWDPASTGISGSTTGIHTYVFKRGVVYRGTFEAKESGEPGDPIRLTSDPAWGTGEASIYGSRRFTSGWIKADVSTAPKIPDPGKVWYQDITDFMPNTKVVCELTPSGIKRVYPARTPNYRNTPDDPMKTWPVWTNKETYDAVNKNLWLADTKNITQSDPQYYVGGTVWSQEDKIVMCTVWGQTIKSYDPSKNRISVADQNFGGKGCHYFIENTPYLLDSTSEYYYDAASKRMFIRLEEDKDPNTTTLEIAITGKLLIMDTKHDIVISGLTFGFTTADAIRFGINDGIATIQLSGSCYDIEISHNKFTYVNGAVSARNISSLANTSHDIVVSDNDMQVIDDMAIAFSNGGNVYFDKVKILRNRIYDNGARHLGRWYSSIPAIIGYFIDAEIAGNIVDISWGNGLDFFWGKSGTDSSSSIPFIRGLVHHNKASNTLIGTNDYGGIENWQGGPTYCYNNISHNASGYKHFNNSSLGYAFYHDGSFKQYIFNNIASGISWNRNNSGFMQVLGFYNMYVHNTGYRMNSLHTGAVNGLDSGGHNSYLGNLGDSVNYQTKTSLKPDQVAFESYGNNVFSKTAFRGSFVTDEQSKSVFWTDKNLVDLATFKMNLADYKPQLDEVGIEAMKPVIPMAYNSDFRPDSESEAIDRGVKFFASFPLYAVVGEWNFYKHPADSSIIMADNFYMTDEYANRQTYYTVPENNLKAHGVTLSNFVKGQLEDWTEGALHFDGAQTYCELDHTITSTKVCTNVDMTTNNFIIETFFRTEKDHTVGVMISKYDPSGNGYQLDIDQNGKARISLIESGSVVYSLASFSAVNDSAWHHLLVEVNRSGNLHIFIDGKISNGSISGTFPSASLSLENTSNLLVGKNHDGNFFHGSIDFLRISKGNLANARTTIQELYAWELDGPFLKDITGKEPMGKRDAGAIEVGTKTCELNVVPEKLEFPMEAGNSDINIDSETGFEIYKTLGSFISAQTSPGKISVSVPDNSGTFTSRTGEIWLTGCNDSYKISVSQAAAPCVVDAEPDTIIFGTVAGDTVLTIVKNNPVTVNKTSSFISVSLNPVTDSLTITVASNSTSSRRTGYVYIIGCKSDTITIIQESSVSVHDWPSQEIKIYPNPSEDGRFFISRPGYSEKSQVTIQDLTGKVLYNSWLQGEFKEVVFNHEKGFYILKIFNKEYCYTYKILIK